jgi:hypothetical protein
MHAPDGRKPPSEVDVASGGLRRVRQASGDLQSRTNRPGLGQMLPGMSLQAKAAAQVASLVDESRRHV